MMELLKAIISGKEAVNVLVITWDELAFYTIYTGNILGGRHVF